MDILNIFNIDKEKLIKEAIKDTNNELNGLTTERTCLIYTSHLYYN